MTLKKTTKAEATLFTGQSTTGPGVIRERTRSTDFVCMIVDYQISVGLLDKSKAQEAEDVLRPFLATGTFYAAARSPDRSEQIAREILSRFNGKNARQIARALGVGKTTVYRVLKQAGRF